MSVVNSQHQPKVWLSQHTLTHSPSDRIETSPMSTDITFIFTSTATLTSYWFSFLAETADKAEYG